MSCYQGQYQQVIEQAVHLLAYQSSIGLQSIYTVSYTHLDVYKRQEEYNNNADISKMFDYFGITYNKIVSLYSTFTYFFRLSKKDRLIESTRCV